MIPLGNKERKQHYFLRSISLRNWATAPRLVQMSCDGVSPSSWASMAYTSLPSGDWMFFLAMAKLKPIESSLFSNDVDDSLLVLLHNLNGIFESIRRWNASTAFGVGVEPTCRFPEISISKPAMWGRRLPWLLGMNEIECCQVPSSCRLKNKIK